MQPQPEAHDSLPRTARRRAVPQRTALVLLTALLLLPFLAKPVHLDDPTYIWAAQHISERPLDFYGFDVNWYGWLQPMHEVMQNPPLASYWLALAGSLFGWSEPVLHVTMGIVAIAALLGAYELARALRAPPLSSAVILLVSPGFLVSATTLMCDVTMLACWLWALVAWRRGVARAVGSREAAAWFVAAGLLTSAASLAKYFGIALLPLLALDALLQRRRDPACGLALVIPVLVLVLFEAWTRQLYGHGLLAQAFGYAQDVPRAPGGGLVRALVTLSFAGAAAIPLLFHAPALGATRFVAIGTAAVLGTLLAPRVIDPSTLRWLYPADGGFHWTLAVQLAVAATTGALLLWLAARQLRAADAPDAALLAAWVAGTLVFAGGLNWTTSVRSVLPLLPAAAILLARAPKLARRGSAWRAGPLAASGALALAVCFADQSAARAARTAAETVAARYGAEAQRLYFQGHWGFQYSMQALGFRALDVREPDLRPGDLVIVPLDNTNARALPPEAAADELMLRFALMPWLCTMSEPAGAGFYSSIWGPLPYALGSVPPQEVLVQRVR